MAAGRNGILSPLMAKWASLFSAESIIAGIILRHLMLDWVRGSVTCVFLAFPKMETARLVGHAELLSVADAIDTSSRQTPMFIKHIL